MEHVKLKSSSGVAKLTGVLLCLAGVLVIAFYTGPSLSPVNHHRAFASHAPGPGPNITRGAWAKWTFLMVLANTMWSLWIVLQVSLSSLAALAALVLKECPDKIVMTAVQCVFSAVQSFVVAMVAERDFSKWKLGFDVSLLAIFYAPRTTRASDRGVVHATTAMVIQVIQASTVIVSKAAFDRGLSTFVYIFYRLHQVHLRDRGIRDVQLCTGHHLLPRVAHEAMVCGYSREIDRMEVIKLRSSSGMAKAAGVALCLAGALVIALYAGRSLSPLNHHRVLAGHGHKQQAAVSRGLWITGTFLMLLGCVAWSLWIVFQEYPNKLLATLIQCLFGMIQSCLVTVIAERDHPSRWKLGLDFSLFAGIVGTGVCFYLQTWCVGMEGPVFLAMWTPLLLLLTGRSSTSEGKAAGTGANASFSRDQEHDGDGLGEEDDDAVIYAATIVISKASFDQGLSVFVYIFYRQAAACLILLPLAILLER
ncbi:hypothetical protein HU200_020151 [Digitaria exilis]|uniref:WAT1-related protein n=1 Tax=Digitaria exilis TaxID=1010633 RepID=A0A835F1F9_9POAL|nr:hypothetical protein HU200_020151 [Digitaria exilis]